MFIIIAKKSAYDGRDAICGARLSQAVPYAYETAALAQRMMPSTYDEDGQSTDISYYVVDTRDPVRRPIQRASAVGREEEDVPF
jgi:hypothetical protein